MDRGRERLVVWTRVTQLRVAGWGLTRFFCLPGRGLAMCWRFSEKKERSRMPLVNTREHPRVPAVVVSGVCHFSRGLSLTVRLGP